MPYPSTFCKGTFMRLPFRWEIGADSWDLSVHRSTSWKFIDYVDALQEIFHFPPPQAFRTAAQLSSQGQVVIWSGSRRAAAHITRQLLLFSFGRTLSSGGLTPGEAEDETAADSASFAETSVWAPMPA
jgi:hypothetical protein